MKIKDYKAAVTSVLEKKLEAVSEDVQSSEEASGFAYELACDAELIGNLLKAVSATKEDMNERIYKGIQFSLSKNFKAVCTQAAALKENKAFTKGRKASVVCCKQLCKEIYKNDRKSEGNS